MKKFLRPKFLPAVVVVMGLLGFFLRLWTLGSGPDREGLYEPQPMAWTLLWIVTVLTLAVIVVLPIRLKNPGRYTDNFSPSLIGAIGNALAALGILTTSLKIMTTATDLLASITGILGVVAAVCMLLVAFARLRGQRPSFLFHAAACLYFALRIFDRCRDWSNEPQISIFLFPFLASLCVMLAAYQLASFGVDLGKRRQSLFWSLSGVYFCMLSLANSEDLLFYGCMAVWLMTNLCSLRLLKVRKPQSEETTEKTQAEAFMDAVNQDPTATLTPQPEAAPAEKNLADELSLDELRDWLDKQ